MFLSLSSGFCLSHPAALQAEDMEMPGQRTCPRGITVHLILLEVPELGSRILQTSCAMEREEHPTEEDLTFFI